MIRFALAALFLVAPSWANPPKDFPAPKVPSTLSAPGVRPVVGLRPFRQGGIRMDEESLNGTFIVHNYGHGGAGLTLSWGTVYDSMERAKGALSRTRNEVMVIGGGVIGLTTAYQLQKEGYSVAIYSDAFFPDNVSNVAGGLWSPVSVDMDAADPAMVERLQRIQVQSWREYRGFVVRGWPVRLLPMFVTEEAREKSGLGAFEALPDIFKVTRHDRLPIQGVTQGGYEVETIMIDTPRYMRKLFDRVKSNGARLVQRKFGSLQEAAETAGAGSVIFHCTGLGARELARDASVIPVRGDLVYLEARPGFDPSSLEYLAFYGSEGTDYMFPREREVVVGGTFRKGESSLEVEPAMCERMLKSLAKFLGQTPKE